MTDWFSVYRSFDAGRSWTNMTEGIEVTYVDALEQDPSDPAIVHLGVADIGYFRSDDGGVSFSKPAQESVITNNVKSLARAPPPSRAACTRWRPTRPGAAGTAATPFRSDDAGDSWAASAMTGLPRIGLDEHHGHTIASPDDAPDTAFLAVSQEIQEGGGSGGGGLYRSDDAGADLGLGRRGAARGRGLLPPPPLGQRA